MVMIFGCEVWICAGGKQFLKQSWPQWGIFHRLFWMNDFFVLFCWKSVMEFLHPAPWIGDFPVIVPYLSPRSMKRNENILNRGGFFLLFFTLKMFQLGISGRPGGFPGSAPGSFAKGILWGSRLASGDSLNLDRIHLLSPLKPCDIPSPLLPPLLCPSPFLCLPRAHWVNPWEGCFGESLLFLETSARAETAWFEAQSESSLQGHKDFVLCSPGRRERAQSLPLPKLWVVI